MRYVLALLFALCAACGVAPSPRADPKPPPPEARSRFEEGAARLFGMLDHGWVVSRHPEDGSPEHQGDSLIWSGMALGALDCERGRAVENALFDMLAETGGGLYRHPSLKNEVSLDGALGFYRGLASWVKRCPGAKARWRAPFALHRAYLDEHGGRLNVAAADIYYAKLVPEFNAITAQLGAELGVASPPADGQVLGLGVEVLAWAKAVVHERAACYRIHLGLIALQALELAGRKVPALVRNDFCATTAGLGLETTDLWCGRPSTFLADFRYDSWEFSGQRCKTWETPDGQGLTTPAVDLLTYLRDAYAF